MSTKKKNEISLYLHHQFHCIVEKLRKCHRANIRLTADASACALMCILINHVDVADSSFYHVDATTCDHAHCGKPSNRHAAVVPLSNDNNGFRWHDFVYAVTSYMAVPVDPLGYTSQSEDTPVTLTTMLYICDMELKENINKMWQWKEMKVIGMAWSWTNIWELGSLLSNEM